MLVGHTDVLTVAKTLVFREALRYLVLLLLIQANLTETALYIINSALVCEDVTSL